METVIEKTNKAVRSLIIINNDRYEGYKTAAEETHDTELKALFTRLSQQSQHFSEELKGMISYDEAPEDGETTLAGKVYRIWMDIKAAVTAKDRKAILNSCEFGEDTAKKTYEEVLKHRDDITPEMFEVIRKQSLDIKQGHDAVKALRDSLK